MNDTDERSPYTARATAALGDAIRDDTEVRAALNALGAAAQRAIDLLLEAAVDAIARREGGNVAALDRLIDEVAALRRDIRHLKSLS
jgi:hypothetical protein